MIVHLRIARSTEDRSMSMKTMPWLASLWSSIDRAPSPRRLAAGRRVSLFSALAAKARSERRANHQLDFSQPLLFRGSDGWWITKLY